MKDLIAFQLEDGYMFFENKDAFKAIGLFNSNPYRLPAEEAGYEMDDLLEIKIPGFDGKAWTLKPSELF
jgi:hypothetical protein